MKGGWEYEGKGPSESNQKPSRRHQKQSHLPKVKGTSLARRLRPLDGAQEAHERHLDLGVAHLPSTEIGGDQWRSMEFRGDPWRSAEISGDQRRSAEIVEARLAHKDGSSLLVLESEGLDGHASVGTSAAQVAQMRKVRHRRKCLRVHHPSQHCR